MSARTDEGLRLLTSIALAIETDDGRALVRKIKRAFAAIDAEPAGGATEAALWLARSTAKAKNRPKKNTTGGRTT
jgi:hypothetical protein